jgi:hypothetical protein
VDAPIDSHGPSDSGFTGHVRAVLLGQQAVEAKAPGARVRLWEIEDCFEERQR